MSAMQYECNSLCQSCSLFFPLSLSVSFFLSLTSFMRFVMPLLVTKSPTQLTMFSLSPLVIVPRNTSTCCMCECVCHDPMSHKTRAHVLLNELGVQLRVLCHVSVLCLLKKSLHTLIKSLFMTHKASFHDS